LIGARRSVGTLSLLATVLASGAGAQASRTLQPELRVHLGVGVAVPTGTYLRLAFVAAAGPVWHDGRTSAGGRADATARFVIDPFRQSTWGVHGAAGIGALYDEHERWRPVILLVLGVEGPSIRATIPAFEVGLGGGVRAGLVLRRAVPNRR
jgi:hypothetical protein